MPNLLIPVTENRKIDRAELIRRCAAISRHLTRIAAAARARIDAIDFDAAPEAGD